MYLNIRAEHGLIFEIEFKDKNYLLRMHNGEWQLMKDGGVIRNIGQARIHEFNALHRALTYVAEL